MLQDPNVERVIKNYIVPLQKQISMMQIELEALKQQCNIGAGSVSLPDANPHICPECSWQCTCSDHPCSCCNE